MLTKVNEADTTAWTLKTPPPPSNLFVEYFHTRFRFGVQDFCSCAFRFVLGGVSVECRVGA